MLARISALATLALAPLANAVTIYTLFPTPTQYDTVVQTPNAAPTPGVAPGGIAIALPTGAVPGLSKPQRSDFLGLSLEMSVSTNIMGMNGSWLNPIFLNHIQNIRARAGSLTIRIGGNSQEKATLVPATLFGPTINKTVDPVAQAHLSNTPLLTFSEDLFYVMSNISSLIDVQWTFGLPFLNPTQIPNVVNAATQILGSSLDGFQMANEPDQYGVHGNEAQPWTIQSYMALFGQVRSQYVPTRTDIFAPNVCCFFTINDILAAGFLQQFGQFLKAVTVQHYKDDACTNPAPPPPGVIPPVLLTGPQAFATYQTHASAQEFFVPYLNASVQLAAAGKDLIMLETNTASCGGYPGASDTFAAALYLLDLALQGAAVGFSQILLHSGGQGNIYNLFTPPPGNLSRIQQWTTGAPYYSALIMAEAMSENGSQVMDLLVNNNNSFTAGYGIYNNGNPVRLALFNYITDPSGANDVNFQVSIGGGTTGVGVTTPSSVNVKYFSTATGSAADKFNLTWAGQTMGDAFNSDGRLQGTESIQTIQCNGGVCNIPVKAPQFALVLFDVKDSIADPAAATQTFATTIATRLGAATIVVPASVLAVSNGRGGSQELLNIGGTSPGKSSDATRTTASAVAGLICVGVVSGMMILTGLGHW